MYIKFMKDENPNIYVSYWLLLITFLIGIMIVVGGLTRLTDSGLSITKWDLISGIMPPLTTIEWEKYFSLYKEIPEYKEINYSMTLTEFKTIYWWEYIHRLLGRLIGLTYLIPLLYFTFKKKIRKNSLVFLYTIFFLILIQGIVGWYMVKSGLIDRVDVSHYRLSLHLTLAFIIYILVFWSYLQYRKKENSIHYKKGLFNLLILFLFLLIIQISVGALVSGLDAGKIYQSWPLMNGNYFPNDSVAADFISLNSLSVPSLVQFLHRNLAYLIFFIFLFILILTLKNDNYKHLRVYVYLVTFFLFFQIFLGILTIISGAQIILASMHQIGSIFLVTSTIVLIFKNSKTN